MADNGTTFSMDGLQVYFQSRRAKLDAQLTTHLVDFINATKNTLDCAIYDLRSQDVLNALASIANSGKQLRIAYDASGERSGGPIADPKPSGTQQALGNAGLLGYATPVHETGRQLMHDKFLVRDGQFVWTGSANFTDGGLKLQDNNCLIFASPELAKCYTTVFEDVLQGSLHRPPYSTFSCSSVTIGEATLTPFFAPHAGEGIEQVIIKALTPAQRVRVLAFLISDPGILGALSRFTDPNADIRGVYDPNGMNDVLRYKQPGDPLFWFLKDSRFIKAPSRPFNPRREQDFMHNKVLIIDDRLVVTGSYNFSENAEANDENLMLIESSAVAAVYTSYFDTLYTTYSRVS